MGKKRIHITGASGSGVTTIGRALAQATGLPHHDTDDYFWLPTEPPFKEKRPIEDRIRLMRELFVPRSGWVLSGSLGGWAKEIEPCFDAVVFVSTPTPLRIERLRKREELRYGVEATLEGGSHYEDAKAFLTYAANYDDPSFNGRSQASHEIWLRSLNCPITRVNGHLPTSEVVDEILRQYAAQYRTPP